jgi:hypothetical protein
MTQHLINHQGFSFIAIREDYWRIISSYQWSKTLTAAACKVLAVLEGWTEYVSRARRTSVKMSVRQLTETIKEHGVRTIAKAAELLSLETPLLHREKKAPMPSEGCWENPAMTWWYELNIEAIQESINSLVKSLPNKGEDAPEPPTQPPETKRSSPPTEALDPLGSGDSAEGIEIVESSEISTENTPQINNASVLLEQEEEGINEEELIEEELGQESDQTNINEEELKALCINYNEVKDAIKRNSHNYDAAIARVKESLIQGWGNNPTGLLLKTLRNGWGKYSAAAVENRSQPEPTSSQLEMLYEQFGEEKIGKTIHPVFPYPWVWAVDLGSELVPWWQVS